ncbi:glutamyl-tRNA(Gln) amidotransferase subunit C [Gloeomargarita lithophora Alchichica-D10]|uniref:Aspartyl/glutamyl-tRNA(Asn/Gln) amidotransferase subunit C n=1 Tax=Gloeomargarita lithophora Alchichica-D10 TaxID=1188229 RepID=A0A1J0AAZ8_9CYAN|nr:Asp-tRNA(Asn)/Glu-tRNA(Gln) amidotransferase subunit GatC [Gloeomargarita lithophora]APB33112.1 glutamyl-tRNA(Gln) amidotransferase subunit C [Gloeomargarita lithophora Alchichica-D10]
MITPAQTAHLAHLARLELTPAEIAELTGQLGAILDYMAQLQSLDLGDVPPTAHAVDTANVLRPDQPHASALATALLQAAPAPEDRFFQVPQILREP